MGGSGGIWVKFGGIWVKLGGFELNLGGNGAIWVTFGVARPLRGDTPPLRVTRPPPGAVWGQTAAFRPPQYPQWNQFYPQQSPWPYYGSYDYGGYGSSQGGASAQ